MARESRSKKYRKKKKKPTTPSRQIGLLVKEGVIAWNAWREKFPKTRINLRNANLTGLRLDVVNLQGAYIEGADLSNSVFDRANLAGAMLRNATLNRCTFMNADLASASLKSARGRGIDFSGANLSEALLQNSSFADINLENAILRQADLSRASLSKANLLQTDFAKTVFDSTNIIDTDLSVAINLKDAVHLGPSSIGVDTMYAATTQLPIDFLRGCGVPDDLISLVTGVKREHPYHSAFISYSHADKDFAIKLHDQLQARGIRCWLDQKDLVPGDRILDAVGKAIQRHDKLLLCCSINSLTSWWVKDEIRKAQDIERREGFDIIIPLNIDDYLLGSWQDGLASDITSRLAADFRNWQADNNNFEKSIDSLLCALGRQNTP